MKVIFLGKQFREINSENIFFVGAISKLYFFCKNHLFEGIKRNLTDCVREIY